MHDTLLNIDGVDKRCKTRKCTASNIFLHTVRKICYKKPARKGRGVYGRFDLKRKLNNPGEKMIIL